MADMSTLTVLLGTPLMMSESRDNYAKLMDQLVCCLHITDAMELILVKDVLEETWTILRHRRCLAGTINRRIQLANKMADRHSKAEFDKKSDQKEKIEVEKYVKEEPDIVVPFLKETLGVSSERNIDRFNEFDEADAYEKCIAYQQKVDDLIARALKRRNDALQQLAWYRCNLVWNDLREASDAVIGGQTEDVFGKCEAPIAPSDE